MNTNRDLWIGIGALAVIGALLLWYLAAHPAPAHAPTTPSGNPSAAAPDGHITEHAQYYDIDAAYPARTPLSGVSADADAEAVALMKGWAADAVAQFKKDSGVDDLTPADISMQGLGQDGRAYALDITYGVASSTRTVTYVYTTYEDTLGAHPNSFYRTFTFDTQTGASLALGDLFTSGSDYLGRLSKAARAQLPAQLAQVEGVAAADIDMGMLDAGTEPKADNFADFLIDGNDLVILFAPYQVAPYAAGPQELSIPLASLSDILKPAYSPR